MKTRKFSAWLRLPLIIVTVLWASPLALAQGSGNPDPPGRMRSMTRAQRKAARLRAAPQGKGVSSHFAGLNPETATVSPLAAGPNALAAMTPGASPDYFGVGNYANSPFPVIAPGPIQAITVLTGGGGYHTPVVTITDPTGSGATATATAVKGVITSVTVNTGGVNYSNPVVTIADNGNAAGATAFVSSFGTISGGIHKFVDTLPGLTAGGANNLGAYIPLAVANTGTFLGSDYYHLGLKEFTHRFHSDLPATNVRGYFDMGSADSANHYLGPLIVATRNRPVRILFENQITTDLNIPVDTTYMGSGMVDDGFSAMLASKKRATLHLHGGNSPWISDGTTHQWITPAGGDGQPNALGFSKGFSFQNVPDMLGVLGGSPSLQDGKATFYWTNEQSGRLMFYHDHAYGITRLNVYAGEAAGYLLVDPAQETPLAAAGVPGTIITDATSGAITTADLAHLVPLVIQDKSFVPDDGLSGGQLAAQDPTWDIASWGGSGSLWFPHVYMPNQNPADLSGSSPYGRWDYGPWFWPPQNPSTFALDGQPYSCTSAADPEGGWPFPPLMCPGTPRPSGVPEGFMDTPIVNGTAYPKTTVAPAAYRFQVLSAGNDRAWNLQLYYAVDKSGVVCKGGNVFDASTCTEVSMVPAVPHTANTNPPLCTTATQFGAGGLTVANLDAAGNPLNGTGLPSGCWPTSWPTDGREGGVPDPATAGPPLIQIGSEGGLLPAPAAIPSTPINYEYARRSITVLNVLSHGLFLGPAERADVVVDFSGVPSGSILILYNDAPAPVPALDSRIDYYTGNPDQTDTGGAPSTQPGYGPNTRTIMQIAVSGSMPNAVPFSLPAVAAALPDVFAATQDPIIVPETAYPAANGGTTTSTYSRIFDTTATFVDHGSTTPTVHQLLPKTIQELFTLDYGRMNATLGVELPFTSFLTQTTIPYGYIDPPTEIFKEGETQLWKITHNGVDTHFIHFHLFTVQVVNRVGWDGAIKPPDPNELSFKDTVRMNPLEDIIVALKPIKQQNLPWPLPDSIRPMDVTMPTSSTTGFTNIDPANNPILPNVTNNFTNFGWEYVWHCHILGHEENDMMRTMVFQVAPLPPSSLTASTANLPSTGVALAWTDNSANESSFTIERADDSGFTQNVTPFTVAASAPNTAYGATLAFNDAAGTATQFYRVRSVDDNFKPPFTQAFNATPALLSDWSNPASVSGTASVVITADAVVIPAPNAAGWINLGPVTVRITAHDNGGAAVASISYSATGSQVIPLTTVPIVPPNDTTDVSITAQGVTVVSFQATDANGKSSPIQTVTVKLDSTTPTAVLSPGPNAAGWNCCSSAFTITGSDGLSGVATIDYTASGATILQNTVNGSVATFNLNEGNTTLLFSATDVAGNPTFPQMQVAVNLDRTPPVLTAGSNPASANRGNRTVKVNVSGTATDALSLINPASGSYSVKNGANVVVATGTFTISNGAYGFQVNLSANTRQTFTITVKAKDQADNTGTAVTTFVIR